jgi:hypothetical protein
MAWLGTLRKKTSRDEVEEEEEVQEAQPQPSGPSLVLLIPNVAGVGAFRLVAFPDAQSAAEYIDSSVLPQVRSGLTAFWALHREPPPKTPQGSGEALVLIRSAAGSDVVYVVSFVDLESAESFARFEVKRGLDIGLVMIYWAALITVHEGADGISLTPAEPPTCAAFQPEATQVAQGITPVQPDAEKPTASLALVEEAQEGSPVEVLEETGRALSVGAEAAGNGDTPVIEEVTEPEATQAGASEAGESFAEAGVVPAAGEEKEDALDAGEVLAAATKILVGDEELVGEGAPAGEAVGEAVSEKESFGLPAAVERVAEAAGNGAEAPAMTEEQAAEQETGRQAAAKAHGQGQPPGEEQLEEDEIAKAVQRLLKYRRWEKKDTPFRGFDSPPGRF